VTTDHRQHAKYCVAVVDTRCYISIAAESSPVNAELVEMDEGRRNRPYGTAS